MSLILSLVLAQAFSPGSGLNLNTQAIESRQDGVRLKATRQWAIDCRSNMTCSVDGGTLYLSAASSGGVGGGVGSADGGTAAPLGAPFVTWQADATLTASRKLSAGNYTAVDNLTPGESQIDWAHGLTCSAGQSITSSGTAALVCTSTITASDLACSGTCVADAEIVGISGSKVSGTVPSATALASDPADCSAGQYATTIAASGALTCAQVATSQLGGTITNAQLASSYSGIGACGANAWASTLSANAAPTCTQPGFSNLSGVASVPQGGTGIASRVDDDLVVGTGANTTATKILPSCSNATTSKLLYDSAANSFSCGTDQTSAGGGYATILDEAGVLTARTSLNFTGAGVSCVDNAGATRTDCTIAGGGGGGGGNFLEAEVDFGAGGDTTASVVVTGASWVGATSTIVCAPTMTSTADRSEGMEDTVIEGLSVAFHSRSAGVGFTIVASPAAGLAFGKFKIHCSGG
jgi:hypothetical protein